MRAAALSRRALSGAAAPGGVYLFAGLLTGILVLAFGASPAAAQAILPLIHL